MARSNGIYTLPSPQFINGTDMVVTPVNNDFSDIATALTMSLSDDGQTPITGPLEFSSGTAAAPGITFGSDSTTGLYLNAAGQLGFAVSGASAGVWSTSGLANATFASTSVIGPILSGTVTINSSTINYGSGSAAAQLLSMGMGVVIPYTIVIPPSGSGNVGWLEVPFPILLSQYTLAANQACNVSFNLGRTTYANFPNVTTIAGMQLSGATNNQQSIGPTQLNAGDWLSITISGFVSGTKCNLSLFGTRTAQ